MSYELNRKPIGDHIHFSSVTHPKFKHNRLSVNFVLPLDAATASDNAVVPFILRKGCRECPDFTSLNARLAELYGAALDADVSKYAAYQVLEVSIRGLDNRFALENEDISAQCADLLASVVLDPNLDAGGLFHAADVELEKQYVIDSIDAQINDKRSYAVSRCIQEMCQGEPVALRRYGSRETAEKITPASATAAYRRMLECAPVEIFFTGCGDPAGAEKTFAVRFQSLVRNAPDYQPLRLRGTVDKVKETTETMELSQSKLVLGLRTGTVENPEQVVAMRVFTALFGGTPFSKLFLNVREKLSLCYYCAGRFDVSTQLMWVDSGVEAANKQKALDEIMRQLKAVQDGDFDEETLHDTKLLMKNSVTSMTDSLSGIEGWYLAQILREQAVTPEQDVQRIEAVTREAVIQAAGGVALDTVYFLTGNQKEGM